MLKASLFNELLDFLVLDSFRATNVKVNFLDYFYSKELCEPSAIFVNLAVKYFPIQPNTINQISSKTIRNFIETM